MLTGFNSGEVIWSGAVFGVCAVSIVKDASIENLIKYVDEEYKEKIGYEANFYVVESCNGPVVFYSLHSLF